MLRPLRLPCLLVGDPRLGGISSTISAYESLLLRGYDVDVVVFMDPQLSAHATPASLNEEPGAQQGNAGAVRQHFAQARQLHRLGGPGVAVVAVPGWLVLRVCYARHALVVGVQLVRSPSLLLLFRSLPYSYCVLLMPSGCPPPGELQEEVAPASRLDPLLARWLRVSSGIVTCSAHNMTRI